MTVSLSKILTCFLFQLYLLKKEIIAFASNAKIFAIANVFAFVYYVKPFANTFLIILLLLVSIFLTNQFLL